SPPPVHGQDWKASSLTAAVTRYQFRRARASGPHVVVPLIPHRSFPRKRESGPANSVLLSRGRAQMNSPERQPASVRGKQALGGSAAQDGRARLIADGSRTAGNPLLNRPLGAFEPVRRLSRPTDERPQEPRRDQKRKAASSTGGLKSPERKRL